MKDYFNHLIICLPYNINLNLIDFKVQLEGCRNTHLFGKFVLKSLNHFTLTDNLSSSKLFQNYPNPSIVPQPIYGLS